MTAEQRELKRLYWWSFAVRLGAGLVGWVLLKFTTLSLLDDARQYEAVAVSIAQDWLRGRNSSWLELYGDQPFQPVYMVVLLACFYTLMFGIRALPLLMVFYGAITAYGPVLTYRLARELGTSAGAARSAGRLVAFCPVFVMWAGGLYKEGLIFVILNLAMLHTLRLQNAWRPRSLAIIGLCLLALCGLRLYLVFIISLVLCLALMLGRTSKVTADAKIAVFVRQAFCASVFLIIAVGVGYVAQLEKVFPATVEEGIERIDLSRRDMATATSGYLADVRVTSLQDAVTFLPLGTAYFLHVPLPWQTGSLRQNLAIPDTTLWVCLIYPLVLVGLARMLRRNYQGCMLIIAATVAMVLFYGIFIGNIGTAYRMRSQVWLLWAVFAGIGWETLLGRPAFPIPSRRAIRRRSIAGMRYRRLEVNGSTERNGRPQNVG